MALIANNISGSASNSSKIGITGSVIFANVPNSSFPLQPGTDSTFFVSGSVGTLSGISVFGGDTVISGTLDTKSNLKVTGSIGASTLNVVSGALYQANGIIQQSNAFRYDSVRQALVLGTSALQPSVGLQVGGTPAIRLGAASSYLNISHAGGTTYRFQQDGASPRIECLTNFLTNTNTFGFVDAISGDITAGFRRAATGIISVSGSAPGAVLRFNATSTPLSAGDLGMSTATGRPQAFIGGTAVSLAHTGEIAPLGSAYVTIGSDATLTNERALGAGTGLILTDGGAGSTVTLGINNGIVATVSGTTFTGVTNHTAGLSGSLTRLTNGTSYLIAGSNVTITTGSNGAVTIAASSGGSGAMTLIETKTLTATGSVTFSSLTGDTDKIWVMEGEITVGSGANIEVYPNGNSGTVMTGAYITNSSGVTSPSGGSLTKLSMPAGSSVSSGERLQFSIRILADSRGSTFAPLFRTDCINDATSGGGAIRQQVISNAYTSRLALTSLEVSSTGGSMTGRISLFKVTP